MIILKKIISAINRKKRAANKTFISSYIKKYIQQNNLHPLIEELNLIYETTGIETSDIVCIHSYIRLKKPKWLLECGHGKSTSIICQALMENANEGFSGKLISMEHSEKWYEHALQVFPERFKPFCDIVQSPMCQYQCNFIIGSCYKDIPSHPYEWIWSDGPHIFFSPELKVQPDIPIWQKGKTHLVPNMDAFRVVQQSDIPVTIFIDFRRSTQLAYAILFGQKKVKHYSDWSDLGVIENVTQKDIILGSVKPLSKDYSHLYELLVDVIRGRNPHWIN